MGTFLVLEALAIITHLNILIGYVGNVFVALLPGFFIILAIIWMIKAIFR